MMKPGGVLRFVRKRVAGQRWLEVPAGVGAAGPSCQRDEQRARPAPARPIGRNLLRFAWVSFALVFTTALDASSWKTFTSTEGGFSILMPGNPELHEHVHRSFVGAIRENTYSATTKDGGYSVEYSDLPGFAVDLGGSGMIFNKAKEGVLKDNGGAETSFNPISLRKHPGKELSFRIPGKDSGKARFFLVGKRLYVLVATSSSFGNVETFLNSFKLLQGS